MQSTTDMSQENMAEKMEKMDEVKAFFRDDVRSQGIYKQFVIELDNLGRETDTTELNSRVRGAKEEWSDKSTNTFKNIREKLADEGVVRVYRPDVEDENQWNQANVVEVVDDMWVDACVSLFRPEQSLTERVMAIEQEYQEQTELVVELREHIASLEDELESVKEDMVSQEEYEADMRKRGKQFKQIIDERLD